MYVVTTERPHYLIYKQFNEIRGVRTPYQSSISTREIESRRASSIFRFARCCLLKVQLICLVLHGGYEIDLQQPLKCNHLSSIRLVWTEQSMIWLQKAPFLWDVIRYVHLSTIIDNI